jgi:hypothetical protein
MAETEDNETDPPPACANHRQQQRLCHVEEAVQRNVQHTRPLIRLHPRHHRVIMDTGIIDQNLDWPAREQPRQGCFGFRRVGDVELNRFRGAARLSQLRRKFLSDVGAAMGIDNDVMPGRGETTHDRLPQ